MGEYARSLAIANAVSRRWQDADIRFVLSRQAPYAADSPFPATLLASSPTFHTAAVIELLTTLRPDVVIFDNAGRTAQLRAARRVGARVVYISARPRQRRKAFRWRWMRLIDEHWIAYPEFIAGRLRLFERLKLKLLRRPTVRHLDVILSRAEPAQRAAILARAGVAADSYVLVVPGGGTGHPGARDAVSRFAAAARSLAAGTRSGGACSAASPATGDAVAAGVPIVFVGGTGAGSGVVVATDVANATAAASDSNWHPLGALPQADLAELMRSARLIVANGGSTLLQAIACGKACVAVPIAHDQAERVRRCVAAGAAVGATLDAKNIAQSVERLLQNEPRRSALARRAAELGLADGVELAVRALGDLLADKT